MTDHEEPLDHPALAKYPDSPTALARVDGVLWRVPMLRDKDEAVPVPVSDVVQAGAVLHRLALLLGVGAGTDHELSVIGDMLVLASDDPSPQTRAEVVEQVEGLHRRLRSCLPYW